MQMTPAQLNSEFKIPGLQFQSGAGELTKASIDCNLCRGEVYLHGAHVTEFIPQGQSPVLWMSQSSLFQPDKPIRGGVPICFPWFGPHPSQTNAPAHGLARTASWQVTAAEAVDGDGVAIVLATQIEPFSLIYRVKFSTQLTLELEVQLDQPEDQASERIPQTIEEALHTYLAISDIRQVAISGLESSAFIDKVAGGQKQDASQQPLRFAAECDRVYLNTTATCLLQDSGLKRTLQVEKNNSWNTVVWNPWIDKSARMPDFGDDEWPGMVCIETANVADQAVSLQPGQQHRMSTTISIQ